MGDKTAIETAMAQTIQSQVRDKNSTTGGINLFLMLARAGDVLPAWWSRQRDLMLRNFWKKSDHLSGAMYTMIAKMTTIPVRVVPKDMSIKSHVRIAEEYTNLLMNTAQFGEGFIQFYSKILEDLFGTDNGLFAEIIGMGDKSGPIQGVPISIAHLDSARCTRTSDPEFPVLYSDTDGKIYKLHYTRVMYASQMPSSDVTMNNVGFCSVSRCVNAAQNLVDIGVYKQEKMGSRPQRQILLTQGGLDPEDVANAINVSNQMMDTQGLNRFAKSIAMGNQNIPNADIKSIELSGLPDGFNEKESTILGMAVISMAFGIDARELFPGMESGASKADAIIQHIKMRGKGPGQTIETVERLFNQKYLPPFLKLVFDYQDDTQDRQSAEIANVRAQGRERDLKNGVSNKRVEREKMLANGELTEAQFEELELEDGRLIDGVEVDVLFHNPQYNEFLAGITETNYEDKENDIMTLISISRDAEKIHRARQALAAIKDKYDPKPLTNQDNGSKIKQPDTSYQQEKFGRKLPTPVTQPSDEVQNYSKEMSIPTIVFNMPDNLKIDMPNISLNIPDTMNISMPKQEPPNIRIDSPVTVNIPDRIKIDAPEQKAPTVFVTNQVPVPSVTVSDNKVRKLTVNRDSMGKITSVDGE
jgi:hypothetical protein